MSTLKVWLIRHGESTANIGLWSNCPQDILLTEKGTAQAKKAAEQIKTKPDLIVVSPFKRAKESAKPVIKHWPKVPVETWMIQELNYLAPANCLNTTSEDRRQMIANYWQRLDLKFCDGEGAESFAHFVERLKAFHELLLIQKGFIVVIGHGQFFKGYQLGLEFGFDATPVWMSRFREVETSKPIANGEIIKLEFRT